MFNSNTDPTDTSPRNRAAALAALKDILKSAPQDLWLATVRRASMREHSDLVFWMLDQTECDFAVAAQVFYQSDPLYHMENPKPLPAQPAPGETFAKVMVNWDLGFFRTHTIELEKYDAPPRLIAQLNQKVMARPRGSIPFVIPSRFLEPAGGEPIDLPPHLDPDNSPHLWPLFTILQMRVPPEQPGLPRKLAGLRDRFLKFAKRFRRS